MRARGLFVVAVAVVAFAAFFAVAAPHYITGLATPDRSMIWLAAAAGFAIVGLTWMIRILRSMDDVEAHRSFFRSQN